MESVTPRQMQEIEEAAFASGISASELMEIAGKGIAREIMLRNTNPGTAIAYLGKGNNAGDAVVALRHLKQAGWMIKVRYLHALEHLSQLTRQHLEILGIKSSIHSEEVKKLHKSSSTTILLDGLLGSGAKGPLRTPLIKLSSEMNSLRQNGAKTIAMDIPSGIDTETGEIFEHAVMADHTSSVAYPKIGILNSSAINYVGNISHTPLPSLISGIDPSSITQLICPASDLHTKRPYDFHKGNAGRVGIIAGSKGMLGAACLTSTGALRSGAGLVTIFCTADIAESMSIKAPTEIMISIISATSSLEMFSGLDALAIGPGLGSSTKSSCQQIGNLLHEILNNPPCPLVIDADGINFISSHGLQQSINHQMILTPHPGEMARLFPDLTGKTREEIIISASSRIPCTLLFKGARTLIRQGISSSTYVNGTGHPGMATAGQGDLLTGVIAGLVAQGNTLTKAACISAWICGRASEIASSHSAEESLITTDTANFLGQALQEWKRG